MTHSERRGTRRFAIRTQLHFHRVKTPGEVSHVGKAINISIGGVCFATAFAMSVGEVIEVMLEMPKRITGTTGNLRRFIGRVAHVEAVSLPVGQLGIGVQWIGYDCVLQPVLT